MSSTYYTFRGDRIALIVRGKTSADHDPSVMAQHADCALSNGAPIGFFGEPAGGGSSGRLPSSIGGTGRSGVASSNMSGTSMVGAVYETTGRCAGSARPTSNLAQPRAPTPSRQPC